MTLTLAPLEHILAANPTGERSADVGSEHRERPEVAGAEVSTTLTGETPFVGAVEWFVDTTEARKPHEFFLVLFSKTTAQAQAALYRHPLDRRPRPHLLR